MNNFFYGYAICLLAFISVVIVGIRMELTEIKKLLKEKSDSKNS